MTGPLADIISTSEQVDVGDPWKDPCMSEGP